MSLKSARSFFEKIKTDEAFAKSVFESESAELRSRLVSEHGFEFTKEDLEQVVSEIDLEQVVGGRTSDFGEAVLSIRDGIKRRGAVGYKCDTWETTSECIC